MDHWPWAKNNAAAWPHNPNDDCTRYHGKGGGVGIKQARTLCFAGHDFPAACKRPTRKRALDSRKLMLANP